MKNAFYIAVLIAMLTGLTGCASKQITERDKEDSISETTAAASDTGEITQASAAETDPPTEPDTAAPETETSAAADNAWKEAYKATLFAYRNSSDYDNYSMWDLQDLDGDGIPELLISEGDYHAAGVRYYYYDNGSMGLLLYEDGEPVRYGSYGIVLVCPEEQLVSIADMHMGYEYGSMNRYENHQLTPLGSFGNNSGMVENEDEILYYVNDEEVSKDDYDQVYEEFDRKHWITAGRQYSFDDLSPLA